VPHGKVERLLLPDDYDEPTGAGQRRVEQRPPEHRGVAGDQRDHDGGELGALGPVDRAGMMACLDGSGRWGALRRLVVG
jgi:hypothetical protein